MFWITNKFIDNKSDKFSIWAHFEFPVLLSLTLNSDEPKWVVSVVSIKIKADLNDKQKN